MTEPLANSPHGGREPLIPIRRARLAELLAEKGGLSDEETRLWSNLTRDIGSAVHARFRERLERLKEAYAPFDPDDDLQSFDNWEDSRRSKLREALYRELGSLLESARYRQLDQQEVEQAVDTASEWGVRLQLDFSVFQYLAVYARGDVMGIRTRRHWRRLFRQEDVGVPLFLRLVAVYALRHPSPGEDQLDPNAIHLKLFKNVPKLDVDMLLPGSRVRMSLWDQAKIVFPTVTGAAITLSKLLKGALWAALAGTFWGLMALLGILAGAVGYAIRSFTGYQRTRDRYQLNLTRSRYYQQLDNSAGVIYRILDEAEEQETREILVACLLLWKQAPDTGWTPRQLQEAAERFLQELVGIPIHYEASASLRKAELLDLVTQRPDGRYLVQLPWQAAR